MIYLKYWVNLCFVIVIALLCVNGHHLLSKEHDRIESLCHGRVDPSLMSETEFILKQERLETNRDDLKHQYDYIIVGAGSAGCVIANRLTENPDISVLLIEAGGIETRAMDIPGLAGAFQDTDGMVDKDTLPEPYDPVDIDWGYFTETSKTFGDGLIDNSLLYPRGKVMGGCSTINFMIYTRGNPEDYNRWGKGWTFKDCHKYFIKAENYHVPDMVDVNYFGKNGPMNVEISSYQSHFSGAILKATQEYGFKELNINGPNQIGVTRLQRTIKNGYRFSANSGYLVSIAVKRPNLHLRRHTFVSRLLIDNSKLVPTVEGVFCHDELSTHTFYARREVIVCAGAINSPQLLMLSGIGPKQHLRELQIPVVKDLPVGENLQDHIYTGGFQFLTNKTAYPIQDYGLYASERSGPLSLPALIEVYAYSQPINKIQSIEQLYITAVMQQKAAENMNMKPGIFDAVYEPFAMHPGYMVFTLLQKPKSRGFLHLRSKDPFSKPRIYPRYYSDPRDEEIMLSGMKEAIRISEQESLQKYNSRVLPVPLPVCAHHVFKSDEYWVCHMKALVSTLFHYCGTCKMGSKNDPTTVVDKNLKVHGVEKLRVVDASIMPEILAGHLNFPTIMIAEKASDIIKASQR